MKKLKLALMRLLLRLILPMRRKLPQFYQEKPIVDPNVASVLVYWSPMAEELLDKIHPNISYLKIGLENRYWNYYCHFCNSLADPVRAGTHNYQYKIQYSVKYEGANFFLNSLIAWYILKMRISG